MPEYVHEPVGQLCSSVQVSVHPEVCKQAPLLGLAPEGCSRFPVPGVVLQPVIGQFKLGL